jgi:hypothetical protein
MAHHAARHPAPSVFPVAAALMFGALGANPAAADIAIGPQAIFSPFDRARVTVEWGEAPPRFGGVVRWANPANPEISHFDARLFDLGTVAAGDRVALPELFSRGQELILGYAETVSGSTLFTHKDARVSAYLDIVARSPDEYLILAPGLQSPAGQSTAMDNALIIVRFAQLPSPGTGVFIGMLVLVASRRR